MSNEFSQFQLGRKANSTNGFTLPSTEDQNAFNQVGNNTLVQNNPVQSPNYIPGQYGFTLNPDGSAEFRNITASGNITANIISATSGTIGGFDIGSDYLRDTANSFGLASTVTGSDDVRFWAGDTYANRATADFRVTEAGAVTASNITITGGSVLSNLLSGVIAQANLDVANAGWSQTCAFSVTDADTVAWGAGSFITAGGTSYSIDAGNTGNMSARTYIYLDTAVSTTVYQTTTTAATAVGTGKVLVATAVNGSVEATFQVFGGVGGQNIDASSIVASSITANEIASSTITAGKLSVATLSSVTADMGTLTAGKIDVGNIEINADNEQILFGSATAPLTGTGIFMGLSGGVYQFRAGNPSGAYILWDNTNLTITGATFVNPIISQHTAGETLTTGQVVAISDGATPYSIDGVAGQFANSGIDINTTQWTAKRFTTGPQDTSIKTVWILLRNDSGGAGSSGNLTVSIQAISGGNPDGTDIDGQTATAAYSLGTSTQKWIQCTFATPPTVSVSTSYYVVIKSDSGGGARNVAENSTAGGNDRETTTSGASWAATTFDCIVIPLGLGIASDRTMKALALESTHTDFTGFVDQRYFPAGVAQANTTQATSGNVVVAGADSIESGMTQSRPQYLHTTTLGGVTGTAPTTRPKKVGLALTATKILVNIE